MFSIECIICYHPFKEDLLNGKNLKAVSTLLNVILGLHISTRCLHSSKVTRFYYENDSAGRRVRVESDLVKIQRFGFGKYIN